MHTDEADFETVRGWLRETPFHEFLRIDLVAITTDDQSVTLRLPFRAEFERMPGTGQIHGGIIACLIDIAGDFALVAQLRVPIPTINFRVDYLRPAVGGTALTAVARLVRAGKTVGVADVEIYDDEGRLLAIGRGSYSTAAGR